MSIIQEYITDRVDYARTAITTADADHHAMDIMTIPTDAVYYVKYDVLAVSADFTQKSSFEVVCLYVNNAGTVTLKGAVVYNYRQRETDWEAIPVILDDTVRFTMIGVIGVTINWKCERTAYIMEDEDDV